MIYETLALPNRDKKSVFVRAYVIEKTPFNPARLRPLVLIVPGGGYSHFGQREQEAVALRMNSLGFHAAILHYSLAPMRFPDALCDAANAVALIRRNAEKWNADAQKIILCGFSAGGHLAASLGAFWNKPFLRDFVEFPAEAIRPDFLCLCYPVVTADEKFCHAGSIQNVIGSIPESDARKICLSLGHKDMRDVVSIEKNISADFPPTFVWHTNQDEAVPAKNTILLATALSESKINFEYHLFNRGKHALALADAESANSDGTNAEAECATWVDLFRNWISPLLDA